MTPFRCNWYLLRVCERKLRKLLHIGVVIVHCDIVLLSYCQWRRQASEFGGGGHLKGKLIFWGGKIEFLKRYFYLPPGDSPPSQKGAIFLGICPPPLGYSPPIYAMWFIQIISWYFHLISALIKAHTDRTLFGIATRIFSFQWHLTHFQWHLTLFFQIFGTT
jgi:hypothetical protein